MKFGANALKPRRTRGDCHTKGRGQRLTMGPYFQIAYIVQKERLLDIPDFPKDEDDFLRWQADEHRQYMAIVTNAEVVDAVPPAPPTPPGVFVDPPLGM